MTNKVHFQQSLEVGKPMTHEHTRETKVRSHLSSEQGGLQEYTLNFKLNDASSAVVEQVDGFR